MADIAGVDFSQYPTWEKITTPSGGTYYVVPGSPWVYDPVTSGMRGRPILWKNPKEAIEARKKQEDLADQAAFAQSPVGQAIPALAGTAGTVGGALLINEALSKGAGAAATQGIGSVVAPLTVEAPTVLPALQAPGLALAPVGEGLTGGIAVGGGGGGGATAALGGGLQGSTAIAPGIEGSAALAPGIGPLAGIAGVAAVPIAAKLVADRLFPEKLNRPFIAEEAAASPRLERQINGFAGLDLTQRAELAKKLFDIGVLAATGSGKIDEAGNRVSKDPNAPWEINTSRAAGAKSLGPTYTLEEQLAYRIYGPGSIEKQKKDSQAMQEARAALAAVYGEDQVDAKLQELRLMAPMVEARRKAETHGTADRD